MIEAFRDEKRMLTLITLIVASLLLQIGWAKLRKS